MVLRDKGPQPKWVRSPDHGAESRAQLAHPLGQLVEINTNNTVIKEEAQFSSLNFKKYHSDVEALVVSYKNLSKHSNFKPL
jgi:hypothetical protein